MKVKHTHNIEEKHIHLSRSLSAMRNIQNKYGMSQPRCQGKDPALGAKDPGNEVDYIILKGKALDHIDLNLVSHRYVSGVLKDDHFVSTCSPLALASDRSRRGLFQS